MNNSKYEIIEWFLFLRDFVTNRLLCQECFQTPSQDFFLRLTQASVLPFYLLVLLICLISTLQTIYRRLRLETTHSRRQEKLLFCVLIIWSISNTRTIIWPFSNCCVSMVIVVSQ